MNVLYVHIKTSFGMENYLNVLSCKSLPLAPHYERSFIKTCTSSTIHYSHTCIYKLHKREKENIYTQNGYTKK